MVTLQILVLSFLVRIRVSQLNFIYVEFYKWKLGYGVMVTLQILVLSFLVRIRVSQLNEHLSSLERCFFVALRRERNKYIPHMAFGLMWGIAFVSYLFSASIALIFCLTSSKSSLSFCTLRFISSTRLLPFLLAALRKPRLFS